MSPWHGISGPGAAGMTYGYAQVWVAAVQFGTVFLVMGIATLVLSPFFDNTIVSSLLAVWGASSLWGIGELFEQKKRVEKGWFPKRNSKMKKQNE